MWTYEPPGRADGTEVEVADMVSAVDTVVVVMADDFSDMENEPGDLLEQGMLASDIQWRVAL